MSSLEKLKFEVFRIKLTNFLNSKIDHKVKVKIMLTLKFSKLKHFQRYYSDCQNFILVKKSS